MPAFVTGEDGQKYGPASELTILQWAREGRVGADTILEDRDSGESKPAAEWDYLMEVFNPGDTDPVPDTASDSPPPAPPKSNGPGAFFRDLLDIILGRRK